MPNTPNEIKQDSNFINLRSIHYDEIRSDALTLFLDDEDVIQAFKTIRDQVLFTTKRILIINVQGIIGKRISYFSYPYSKIQYFGVETAGVLDIDSELLIGLAGGKMLQFDFATSVDIRSISYAISKYIL